MIRSVVVATCLATSAASAVAAERLPVSEAARPCPSQGPGFVQVPGTMSCIRIGGRVASEYGTSTRRVGRDNVAGFRSTGRVSADVRTDTDYGPVRTFVRARVSSDGIPSRR